MFWNGSYMCIVFWIGIHGLELQPCSGNGKCVHVGKLVLDSIVWVESCFGIGVQACSGFHCRDGKRVLDSKIKMASVLRIAHVFR